MMYMMEVVLDVRVHTPAHLPKEQYNRKPFIINPLQQIIHNDKLHLDIWVFA